ncbi:MAG: hypothetical protein AAB434_11745 [Planctomycetota bacterium]
MGTTLALILAGAALAQAPTDRPDPGEERPFVFERKGRRDPFVDPRTPAEVHVPTPPRPVVQPDFANASKARVERPFPKEASDPVPIARAILALVDEAFLDGRLLPSERATEVEYWVGKMRRLAEGADGVRPLLVRAEETLARARIRAEFDARKPLVTGVLYSLEEATSLHRLGVALFGRPVCVEARLPVPNSTSTVVLRVQGSTTGDHSYSEGESIDEGGTMRVGRIEKNQVAFVYREETILVPSPR